MSINNNKNLIDEIVDKFIELVLKDRPILAFDLDTELEYFLDDNKDIDIKNIPSIQLIDESLDQQINEEAIQAAEESIQRAEFVLNYIKAAKENNKGAEFVLNPVDDERFDNNFDRDFLVYLEQIEDPLIYRLAHKIIRDNRVRIREPHELEESELSDEYLINKWIFHKDNDYSTDLKYIIDFYDLLNQEDQNYQP